MRSVLLLLGLTACSFHPLGVASGDAPPHPADAPPQADAPPRPDGAPPADAPPPDGPATSNGFQKPITVKNGMVAGDVTGFPMWIAIANDPDLIAHAGDDHADVYFTDNTGAQVPFEITAWSRASGVLQAWVRAPHITPAAANAANVYYLRFGGPPPAKTYTGADVFDNGFAAVWHLDAAAATVADATGHANGTVGGTPPGATTGQLGGALVWASSSTQITFANPITGGGSSTITAWVNQQTIAATQYANTIVVLGMPMPHQSRWFYSSYGGGGNGVAAGLYGDDDTTNTVISTGMWHKLDWVVDVTAGGASSTLYVDGQVVSTKNFAMKPNTASGGIIGNASAAYLPTSSTQTMSFNGSLDELRLSSVVRSPQWLATEYANQKSPGSFYTVGTAQAL